MKQRFVRSTVRIYANVVEATNGARVEEVVGNGEGQGAFQRFLLSQPRLVHLPAETPSGMEPEIELRVNRVEWDRAGSVADLQPELIPAKVVGGQPQSMGLPRKYLTEVNDDERTFLTTGDGMSTGERLPTGISNVRAIYRVGGGSGGNVKEGKITQLASPPLNVTKVRNLLPATGGVDRESVEQARKNLPVAVMALDRLVSVPDYESFTRKFAGIAKTQATRLDINGRSTVVVTIAALNDAPVATDSLLFKNLKKSLELYADPEQAVLLVPRELLLLMTKAKIKVKPGYLFAEVKGDVEQAILRRFTFEQAELGESVLLSDLIETIQSTEGVQYVDVDLFDRMRQFYGTGDMVRKAACLSTAVEPKKVIEAHRARTKDEDTDEIRIELTDKNDKLLEILLNDRSIVWPQVISVNGVLSDPKTPETQARKAPVTVNLNVFKETPLTPPNTTGPAPFPAQLAYFANLPGTILLEEIP